MRKFFASAAKSSLALPGCATGRGRVSEARWLLGKRFSPLMILASKASWASAKGGASSIGGKCCSIAGISGFWLRGNTTMFSFNSTPSKNCGKANIVNLLLVSIVVSLGYLSLLLPRFAEADIDDQEYADVYAKGDLSRQVRSVAGS